ncbi:hypothetical protein, partial [Bifidobacterium moukalabense]|uniref:hypothetical protein n=1 Tax=Bifidobacterium moukalabense TaxID=1333651 RepID=UPI001BB1EA57
MMVHRRGGNDGGWVGGPADGGYRTGGTPDGYAGPPPTAATGPWGGRRRPRARRRATTAATIPPTTTNTATPATGTTHPGNADEPAASASASACPSARPAVAVADQRMQSEPPSLRHCSTLRHARAWRRYSRPTNMHAVVQATFSPLGENG